MRLAGCDAAVGACIGPLRHWAPRRERSRWCSRRGAREQERKGPMEARAGGDRRGCGTRGRHAATPGAVGIAMPRGYTARRWSRDVIKATVRGPGVRMEDCEVRLQVNRSFASLTATPCVIGILFQPRHPRSPAGCSPCLMQAPAPSQAAHASPPSLSLLIMMTTSLSAFFAGKTRALPAPCSSLAEAAAVAAPPPPLPLGARANTLWMSPMTSPLPAPRARPAPRPLPRPARPPALPLAPPAFLLCPSSHAAHRSGQAAANSRPRTTQRSRA